MVILSELTNERKGLLSPDQSQAGKLTTSFLIGHLCDRWTVSWQSLVSQKLSRILGKCQIVDSIKYLFWILFYHFLLSYYKGLSLLALVYMKSFLFLIIISLKVVLDKNLQSNLQTNLLTNVLHFLILLKTFFKKSFE